MKKKVSMFVAGSLFCATVLFAQSATENYRFSSDLVYNPERDAKVRNYQLVATDYSINGYYKKGLEAWDSVGIRKPSVSADDSLYFRRFFQVSAKDYILERSKKEQIIMINEAHHLASHRTFTNSLLQGLYDNGYRYLGLEALYDTLLNERKFPVFKSGFYTREPEFGNLISEAIRIGFIVFGYEGSFEGEDAQREAEQAENIVKFREQHPEAKMLIHCGYDHLNEGTPGIKSWEKAMARRVKETSGIDPFTIDQTRYLERGDVNLNHPFTGMVQTGYPVVLIGEDGIAFRGGKRSDKADCALVHPVTKYVGGRPDWLFLNGDRKAYRIPEAKRTQYPVLVLAYRKGEFDQNGVPADVIEIVDSKQDGDLVLKNGTYEIVIKDQNYKVVERYNLEIK